MTRYNDTEHGDYSLKNSRHVGVDSSDSEGRDLHSHDVYHKGKHIGKLHTRYEAGSHQFIDFEGRGKAEQSDKHSSKIADIADNLSYKRHAAKV